MINWLKEKKLYVLGAGMLFVFFMYTFYFTSDEHEGAIVKEDWVAEEQSLENPIEKQKGNTESDEEEKMVMMADIKGEVVNPGVYEVFNEERVIHLIEKAGGLTKDADASSVNFAMKVSDEMVVYIPKQGEDAQGLVNPIQGIGGGNSSETGAKVNLNTATTSDLETLPGIGPAKSSAIVEYRETNGPFKEIEDLKSISGIGEKTFEKLKDQISVK
ncbi:helix-hairpin-helix domain-containing protein [Mesobacillus maritimus]|uniref:helix-hairpin-helix domain-containing protein n=1 Tax=Mesobacillus maritimus TaxID=1643336 RepID=UPI00203AFC38|nr:helix-hairpin-helix domain-containing protein [Mesobacillus maritimus]MCM3669998.1 helix-hairpin-helix domain-containing protein [Mesobacillus maritimus]